MNTNELTAEYICKDKERLQMALHVYEAMPIVRTHVVKAIFEAVGEHIRVTHEFDGFKRECLGESVYFCTEDTGDFWIFAALEHGKRGVRQLYCGVYAEYEDGAESNEVQEDEVQSRFKTKGDLETWSYGKSFSSGRYVAYAYVHHESRGRWHDDDFLRQAIGDRTKVVEDLADLLMRIYRGVFPLASTT